jgi:hypothetical protein
LLGEEGMQKAGAINWSKIDKTELGKLVRAIDGDNVTVPILAAGQQRDKLLEALGLKAGPGVSEEKARFDGKWAGAAVENMRLPKVMRAVLHAAFGNATSGEREGMIRICNELQALAEKNSLDLKFPVDIDSAVMEAAAKRAKAAQDELDAEDEEGADIPRG